MKAESLKSTLPDRCYVFGAGSFGKSLVTDLRGYNVDVVGILDNKLSGQWKDFDITHPKDADNSIPIVMGVHNLFGDLKEIYRGLHDLGFASITSPVELFKALSDLGYVREQYWMTTDFNLFDREARDIQEFRNLLGDDLSKSLYDAILEYRMTGDIECLPDILPINEQYLPRDLPVVPKPMKLIDCGAYVGEIVEFAQDLEFEIESIYAFEPDPTNYSKLVEALASARLSGNSLALPLGVGEKASQLRFAADGNLGAAISESGDIVIQVVSIDECLQGTDVNYVKMDIEGSEQAALNGMESTIRRLKPNLAISAYHKPIDLWSLGLWLNKLDLKYKFGIRCYGHQCFDTVLYAYHD